MKGLLNIIKYLIGIMLMILSAGISISLFIILLMSLMR